MRHAALIAGGLVFVVGPAAVASADEPTAGLYQIAPQANTGNVWKLNASIPGRSARRCGLR